MSILYYNSPVVHSNHSMFSYLCNLAAFSILSFSAELVRAQDYSLADEPWWVFRSVDDVCQPSRLGLKSFDGFKIQRQIEQHSPTQHHTRISHCMGSTVVGHDAYFPLSQGEELAWGRKFCQFGLDGESACFILARTKKMTMRQTSLARHGALIGGIFQCPGHMIDDEHECTNENAIPLYPIYGDDGYLFWHESPDVRHGLFRFPLITSHDRDNHLEPDFYEKIDNYKWYENIDIHEDYTYNEEEIYWIRLAYERAYRHLASLVKVPLRFRFPTTKSRALDKGDGKPRRKVYKRPARLLFEGPKTKNFHAAPLRSPNAELAPIEIEKSSIVGYLVMIPMAIAMTLSSLHIDALEANAFTRFLDHVMDVVPWVHPRVSHSSPPEDITGYFKNFYKINETELNEKQEIARQRIIELTNAQPKKETLSQENLFWEKIVYGVDGVSSFQY